MKNNKILFAFLAFSAVFCSYAMDQNEEHIAKSKLCRALWSGGKYKMTQIDYGDKLFNEHQWSDHPSQDRGVIFIETMPLFGNNTTIALISNLYTKVRRPNLSIINCSQGLNQQIFQMPSAPVDDPICLEILLLNALDRTIKHCPESEFNPTTALNIDNRSLAMDLIYFGITPPLFIQKKLLKETYHDVGIHEKDEKRFEHNEPTSIFGSVKNKEKRAMTLCGFFSQDVSELIAGKKYKKHLYDCAVVMGEYNFIAFPMPHKRHIAHMAFNSDETHLAITLEGGTLILIKPLIRPVPGNYLKDTHFNFA